MHLIQLDKVIDDYGLALSVGEAASLCLMRKVPLKLAGQSWKEPLSRLHALAERIIALDMPVSMRFLTDVLTALDAAKEEGGCFVVEHDALVTISMAIERLKDIFGVELGGKKFFTLSPSDADLLDPAQPLWGHDFAAKFPSALYDLSEGTKCLAFGRGTAAVFHLLRVTEIGLRAVYACLQINIPLTGTNRNWGKIVSGIRDEIARRGKWNEKDLFQEIYARLDSVKDAWRNGTMHVETKHTMEEAMDIYIALRGLMRKVASLMDDAGNPRV